jgi:parvulin-like peptidyl-prolyl isomerase
VGSVKIVYRGGEITPDEVVSFLVLNGQADAVIANMIMHREAVKKARELGLEVADEALQQFADGFRALRSLYSADEMIRFLASAGLGEEDFEAFCESSVFCMLLKEKLADEKAIEAYFINNRSQFDYARISVIVAGEENLAKEIVIQVTEEGADFHALARKHSLDESTKYAGGYRGLLTREMFPPEVSAKVFSASPGELLGPYLRDSMFQLILVEEILRASLSGDVKESIRQRIFREWRDTLVRDGVTIVR